MHSPEFAAAGEAGLLCLGSDLSSDLQDHPYWRGVEPGPSPWAETCVL